MRVRVLMLRRDEGVLLYQAMSAQTGVMRDWSLQRELREQAMRMLLRRSGTTAHGGRRIRP